MTSDFAAASAAEPPVFARPDKGFYVIIGFWALVGVGISLAVWLIPPAEPSYPDAITTPQMLAMMAVVFFLPSAVSLWLMRRLCIAADARGLWIRGAFKSRFVAWPDIEDYELRPCAEYGQQKNLSWICADKKWQSLPQAHAPMDELRARIQAEAQWSRARDWQLSVERGEDGVWPKTYAYRDPSGRKGFALVVAGLLVYFGYSFHGAFSADAPIIIRQIWENLELWGRVGAVLMPFIGLSMFAFLLLPHYAILRAKKRLGHQILRADREALTLVDGATQTRIPWNQVADYFIEDGTGAVALPQCVVESNGARVVFRQEIDNYRELRALIRARATNAKSNDWRPRESTDSDTLGGEASLWTSGAVGVGRKIYHYRTRTTRAMLALGGFFSLVFLIGFGSSLSWRTPEISDLVAAVLFFLPSFILTLVGALAFWRASIQTDENGLFKRGIWRKRALNWSQIESFTLNGYFYEVKGASTVIRYGIVAACESLQAEIEARGGVKMRRTDRPNDDE